MAIQFGELFRGNIFTVQRMVEPTLGFHGFFKCFIQLANEGGAITPAGPGCGNHCPNRA